MKEISIAALLLIACGVFLILWMPPQDEGESAFIASAESSKNLGPNESESNLVPINDENVTRDSSGAFDVNGSGQLDSHRSSGPNDKIIGYPDEVAEWERIHADYSVKKIIEEADTINSLINENTAPIYQGMFNAGQYFVSHPEKGVDGSLELPTDNGVLDSYMIHPDGEVWRVVLLESEHPELYRDRRLSNWLNKEAVRRHRHSK